MTTTINLFRFAHDVRRYASGEVIFRAGDPGDLLYSVVEGEVAIVYDDELLEVLGPGAILGELALIDDGPRSATAIARSACVLAPVDEQRFMYMVQHTPFFALTVMRVLAERLRRERARDDLMPAA